MLIIHFLRHSANQTEEKPEFDFVSLEYIGADAAEKYSTPLYQIMLLPEAFEVVETVTGDLIASLEVALVEHFDIIDL